jgi:hypothetical protein
VGPAAAWVLRGEQGEARDPAVAWVADLVREGGGLAGDRPTRIPLRSIEWAVAALALGLAAGVLGPRRWTALVLVLLAVFCAAAEPVQRAWTQRGERAVVARSVTLEGTGLGLEAGQVVRVLGREGARVRVSAGRDLVGRLPASSLLPVRGTE